MTGNIKINNNNNNNELLLSLEEENDDENLKFDKDSKYNISNVIIKKIFPKMRNLKLKKRKKNYIKKLL